MNGFVTFMASTVGRVTRIIAGLLLIAVGLMEGTGGYVVALIGLVPLAAGIFDICLFAPLFGSPLSGSKIRKQR